MNNYWDSQNWAGLNREEFNRKVPKGARLSLKECRNICALLGIEFVNFRTEEKKACIDWFERKTGTGTKSDRTRLLKYFDKNKGMAIHPNTLLFVPYLNEFVETLDFMSHLSFLLNIDLDPEEHVCARHNYTIYDIETVTKSSLMAVWGLLVKGKVVRKATLQALVHWAQSQEEENSLGVLTIAAQSIAREEVCWPEWDRPEQFHGFSQEIVHSMALNTMVMSCYLYLSHFWEIELDDLLRVSLYNDDMARASLEGFRSFIESLSEDMDEDDDDCEIYSGMNTFIDSLNNFLGHSEPESNKHYSQLLQQFNQYIHQCTLLPKDEIPRALQLQERGTLFNLGTHMRQNRLLERFSREDFAALGSSEHWSPQHLALAKTARANILQYMGFTLDLNSRRKDVFTCVPFVTVLSVQGQGLEHIQDVHMGLDTNNLPDKLDDERFFNKLVNPSWTLLWDPLLYDLKVFGRMDLNGLVWSQDQAMKTGKYDASVQVAREAITRLSRAIMMGVAGSPAIETRGMFALCGCIIGPANEVFKALNSILPIGVRASDRDAVMFLDAAGKNRTTEKIETAVKKMFADQASLKTNPKVFGVLPMFPQTNREIVEGLAKMAEGIGSTMGLFAEIETDSEHPACINLGETVPLSEVLEDIQQLTGDHDKIGNEVAQYDYFVIHAQGFNCLPIPLGLPLKRILRAPQIVRRTEEVIRHLYEGYQIKIAGRLKTLCPTTLESGNYT